MKYEKSRKTKIKRSRTGLGLFAEESIPEGSFIIEYVGDVITRKEADWRGGKYLFETSANRYIDGKARSNKARYINHSCKPNCEIEILRGRVLVFAARDIDDGEELSYDYGEEYFDEIIKPAGCGCISCST